MNVRTRPTYSRLLSRSTSNVKMFFFSGLFLSTFGDFMFVCLLTSFSIPLSPNKLPAEVFFSSVPTARYSKHYKPTKKKFKLITGMNLRGNERAREKKCVDADGLWIYDIISWNTPFFFCHCKNEIPNSLCFFTDSQLVACYMLNKSSREKRQVLTKKRFRCAKVSRLLMFMGPFSCQVNQSHSSMILNESKFYGEPSTPAECRMRCVALKEKGQQRRVVDA